MSKKDGLQTVWNKINMQSVMTRSAQPAIPAVPAEQFVPSGVLQDGEVVLLAIKPSGWFVPLVSWPVLVLSAIASLSVYVVYKFSGSITIVQNTAVVICLIASCVRIIFGIAQWLGRMYILTNRRMLWVQGIFRTDVKGWYLRDIRRLIVSSARADQMLGIASLSIIVGEDQTPIEAWTHIARPVEVHGIVNQAIRSAA